MTVAVAIAVAIVMIVGWSMGLTSALPRSQGHARPLGHGLRPIELKERPVSHQATTKHSVFLHRLRDRRYAVRVHTPRYVVAPTVYIK